MCECWLELLIKLGIFWIETMLEETDSDFRLQYTGITLLQLSTNSALALLTVARQNEALTFTLLRDSNPRNYGTLFGTYFRIGRSQLLAVLRWLGSHRRHVSGPGHS